MKKLLTILTILVFCQILNPFMYNVYAAKSKSSSEKQTSTKSEETTTSEETSLSDAFQGAKDFVKKGEESSSDVFDDTKIKQVSDTIYNILLAVGMVVAIVIGIVLGIQFMMGGTEEQAKIKEALIPYGIGCVVVFGAFGIWKILVELLQNI